MDLRLPRRKRLLTGAVVLALLAGGGTWAVASSGASSGSVVHQDDAMLPGQGERLDTSFFTAGGTQRRPAVLLGHGFGGSKDDVRAQAQDLARQGYAVLTWSARGFGKSTGTIGLNAPDGEVADVSRLVDWLAERPEVRLDAAGDPRVGVTGASYGGAVSLLAAGYDRRIDAIAPQITYWNLADSLFPGGVYKKLWAGIFFSSGARTGDPSCGRFAPDVCAMYQRVAVAGKPDAAARAQLDKLSPSAVARRIKVPTLIVQGQSDSLFPLGQADAMAKAITGNGAPVAVDWIAGGHDGGDLETGRVQGRVTAWFDHYLKGDTSAGTGPAFRVTRTGGVNSTDGRAVLRGASTDRYPGLDGTSSRRVTLAGGEQSISNPAGGSPPAISSLPGIGGLSQLSSLGAGISLDFPGQSARFDSGPLPAGIRVTGSPTVTVRVKASTDDAVLFAKLYDVSADGRQSLPAQLVTPVRVEGAAGGKSVELRLPAVDHQFAAGHRLRLVLATTDLAYASPAPAATYTVSLGAPVLRLPSDPGVATAGTGLPWWTWGMPLGAAVVAALLLLVGRRRVRTPAPDPALSGVPLQITDLSKKYAKSADRYAVRDLTFRVERGQVLGLLGPNGAGKTTTLRMLMGLIRPDGGEVRVFGEAIRPGAPVLSRVGSFVEGAGFLPHLSGRANLDLYWQATGRPAEDAHFDEALEIAGLGDALRRAVRTYSQGMRQRLAIAQAMLGMPDLLILDEPTNGLDPPQIREMREVLIRYAAEGRTVIVSSHLLAEVEQSCTHLVVMDRGRLITAGPVGEITGSADTLLVGVDGELPEGVLEKIADLPGLSGAVRGDDGLLIALDGMTVPQLLVELVRLDVPVTRVGPQRRLEDAFLTLIGGNA
ncbi:alpha/beta fold hydrolase [Streptomyces sp. NPDC006733]|uniref:alpha/beta fold hydrolase n=1 Tax=Streptomyces sp. NPDC006733 TaxID=3155460 RepID=UPI0033DB4AB2